MKTEWNKLILATYNAFLHEHSICPRNHNIDYFRGHLYFDGEHQNKDFTDKIRILAHKNEEYYFGRYSKIGNTYFLEPINQENEDL